MAGSESILPALYEEETLDDMDEDVDMPDAEIDELEPASPRAESTGNLNEEGKADKQESQGVRNSKWREKKKKKKKKKKKRVSFNSVTDINRFVIDTCRHLKEKKSYLVWNAVGCLGVSAMRELVKENSEEALIIMMFCTSLDRKGLLHGLGLSWPHGGISGVSYWEREYLPFSFCLKGVMRSGEHSTWESEWYLLSAKRLLQGYWRKEPKGVLSTKLVKLYMVMV